MGGLAPRGCQDERERGAPASAGTPAEVADDNDSQLGPPPVPATASELDAKDRVCQRGQHARGSHTCHDEALEMYGRALEQRRRRLGPAHPDVGKALAIGKVRGSPP